MKVWVMRVFELTQASEGFTVTASARTGVAVFADELTALRAAENERRERPTFEVRVEEHEVQ